MVADSAEAKLLGRATITMVETDAPMERPGADAYAPKSILTLDQPVNDLKPGMMVWDPASCNPQTTLKNCTIEMSCRFQSPVALEGCTTRAVMLFYSEEIEGVFPSGASVRNCTAAGAIRQLL